MHKSNCINCGAPPVADRNSCLHCGTSYQLNRNNPFSLLKIQSFRLKGLYPFLLFLGIAIAVYIYGIAFDSFSETTLVQITPLWFFPIVFGLYGYFAEFLMAKVISGKAKSIPEAYRNWIRRFMNLHLLTGLLALIVLSPFSFIKTRNSLLIAFAGSVIWGILLVFFFNAIFPAL